MKSDLYVRVFEMTLAAFGAAACAGGSVTAEPSKVPSATQVMRPASSGHAEASCSAAGCGAKADGTPPTGGSAPAVREGADVAAPASGPSKVTGASDSAAGALATPAPATAPAPAAAAAPATTDAEPAAKPVAAKPKRAHKRKSADDDGCGAGSCASAK